MTYTLIGRIVASIATGGNGRFPLGPGSGIVPRGTREAVFGQMFWVFTGLGTLIGAVVIGYLFWNAYRYRATDDGGGAGDDAARPELGELPGSGHGRRHLVVSFSISALVVVSLITWSYGSLLYLTTGAGQNHAADANQQMEVTVVAHQFYWVFEYHDVPGHQGSITTRNKLRIPTNTRVDFRVTSADVFHNFGIPALKVKSDAIPGQTTTTWVVAHEKGTYLARCYELCGQGHSFMTAQVKVVSQDSFDEWYANRTATNATEVTNERIQRAN